jgi:hypothetical protein
VCVCVCGKVIAYAPRLIAIMHETALIALAAIAVGSAECDDEVFELCKHQELYEFVVASARSAIEPLYPESSIRYEAAKILSVLCHVPMEPHLHDIPRALQLMCERGLIPVAAQVLEDSLQCTPDSMYERFDHCHKCLENNPCMEEGFANKEHV